MESITKYKLEYSVGGFSPNEMKSATSIPILMSHTIPMKLIRIGDVNFFVLSCRSGISISLLTKSYPAAVGCLSVSSFESHYRAIFPNCLQMLLNFCCWWEHTSFIMQTKAGTDGDKEPPDGDLSVVAMGRRTPQVYLVSFGLVLRQRMRALCKSKATLIPSRI